MFFAATGLVFGYMGSSLTLAFLTAEPYKIFFKSLLLIALGAFNAILRAHGTHFLPEEPLLFVYFGTALATFSTYVATTISEITSHLKIQALSISYLQKKP
eukprot:TRINITY_DN3644_c0_g1_i1.p2 TRINITY_DN3644_c0_g1~~TRINITY_DN3644_c0_g1_i1.p2  ORF type:complete len:101 (+),score=27.40 TRINITY_DN3644_c0_g1_i1:274-576(+)